MAELKLTACAAGRRPVKARGIYFAFSSEECLFFRRSKKSRKLIRMEITRRTPITMPAIAPRPRLGQNIEYQCRR